MVIKLTSKMKIILCSLQSLFIGGCLISELAELFFFIFLKRQYPLRKDILCNIWLK